MNGGEYDEHGDVGFTGDAAVTTVTTAGGGRVMNSPPAPPRPLTGTEPEPGMPGEDFGDFVGDVVLDDGLEDFEPPPPASDALGPEAVTTVTTAGVTRESSEAAAAGDDDTFIPASASPAPAPRPVQVIHSPPASVDPKPIANRQLDFWRRSGPRGHVPSRVVHSPPRARPRPRRPGPATSGPCAPRGSLTGTGTLRWTGITTVPIDRRRRTRRNFATWLPSWRLTRGGSRRNSTASGGSCTRRSGRRHTPRGSAHLAERERNLEAQLAAVRAQLAAAPSRRGGSRGSAAPSAPRRRSARQGQTPGAPLRGGHSRRARARLDGRLRCADRYDRPLQSTVSARVRRGRGD